MLREALNDELWRSHNLGDSYKMDNKGSWKIAYYPLFGTWDNIKDKDGNTIEEIWKEFAEPRALIEQPMKGGTDFREVPLRYLERRDNEEG